MPRFFIVFYVIISLFFLSFQNVIAGRLDTFESSTKEKIEQPENNSRNKDHHTKKNSTNQGLYNACRKKGGTIKDCTTNTLFIAFLPIHIVVGAFAIGGLSSIGRVAPFDIIEHDSSDEEGEPFFLNSIPRNFGDPLIPFARIDTRFQYISSEVNAIDLRLEIGAGPLAFNYHQTQYNEEHPIDRLDVTRIYGSYRMSFSQFLTIDLGLGELRLEGNERRSYFYTTTPILLHVHKFGLEFRPSWTSNVEEYDIAVLGNLPFFSAKLGYRWLLSNNDMLSGPYIGVSAHF